MLERRPPVLLRAVSLTDCVRVIAAGGEGNLIVLVRLIDGLVAIYVRLGSRADILLIPVSVCLVRRHAASPTCSNLEPRPYGQMQIQSLKVECMLFDLKNHPRRSFSAQKIS